MKHKSYKVLISFIILILIVTFFINKKIEIHFHDRHRLSFLPIWEIADKKGPLTLILLDYHHDSAPSAILDKNDITDISNEIIPEGIKSYNWVGSLITTGKIKQVFWVSGNDLLLPNINSRKDWLQRKLLLDPINIANDKLNKINILSWPSLKETMKNKIKGPIAVSLDLDILTIDPGDNPDAFLNDILSNISKWHPEIITVALSSAYQPSAEKAWNWLNDSFVKLTPKRTPYIEIGENIQHESNEELSIWNKWKNISINKKFGCYFAPGNKLWTMAPTDIWLSLLKIKPKSKQINNFIVSRLNKTESFYNLKKEFSKRALLKYIEASKKAIINNWHNPDSIKQEPYYKQNTNNRGIAVRIISRIEDRGCLALYKGVDNFIEASKIAAISAGFFDPRYNSIQKEERQNLDIEVSIFGEFIRMDSPYDFIPGIHSLILETGNNKTLLQASIAKERNISQFQFLETITAKAGLRSRIWETPNIKLYKAPTVSIRTSFD